MRLHILRRMWFTAFMDGNVRNIGKLDPVDRAWMLVAMSETLEKQIVRRSGKRHTRRASTQAPPPQSTMISEAATGSGNHAQTTNDTAEEHLHMDLRSTIMGSNSAKVQRSQSLHGSRPRCSSYSLSLSMQSARCNPYQWPRRCGARSAQMIALRPEVTLPPVCCEAASQSGGLTRALMTARVPYAESGNDCKTTRPYNHALCRRTCRGCRCRRSATASLRSEDWLL